MIYNKKAYQINDNDEGYVVKLANKQVFISDKYILISDNMFNLLEKTLVIFNKKENITVINKKIIEMYFSEIINEKIKYKDVKEKVIGYLIKILD